VRRDFPALARIVRNGNSLVYLDNAARSQMPLQVIEAMRRFDSTSVANVHRGIHQLSDEATDAYEEARLRVARFLGARDANEIVFVRNTTEAINLVSFSWGMHNLKPGDAIVTSVMEHHSNLVPWQILARCKGLILKHIPITPAAELDLEAAEKLITPDVKLVTIVHLSNVLGVVNDIAAVARMARAIGAVFVIDGSQSAAHLHVNVSELDCDFFTLSGYKMLGPTGIGALWGRKALLDSMEPFMSGGSMIEEVGLHESTWASAPQKFEAGTPNITGAVGLGVATLYIDRIGRDRALIHERELIRYAIDRLGEIGGVDVYGDFDERSSAIPFNIRGMHPHDTASILDSEGVAVRAGHHCAQPLHAALGIDSSTRASFHCYNTRSDVDRFIEAVETAKSLFGF
jgi:cysteine desulfurase/selenocysteine lyase